MSGAVEGVKIAACPFCGSTTGAEPIKDNRKLWSVRCGCGLHGTWNTRRYGAIDSWNDRAHRYRMAELKASLTTPPARSYADGVRDSSAVIERVAKHMREVLDQPELSKDVIMMTVPILQALDVCLSAIRLLSQEPKP